MRETGEMIGVTDLGAAAGAVIGKGTRGVAGAVVT